MELHAEVGSVSVRYSFVREVVRILEERVPVRREGERVYSESMVLSCKYGVGGVNTAGLVETTVSISTYRWHIISLRA